MSSDYEWRPLDALLDQKSSNLNTAIVILNQPITKENESKLIRLWKSSKVKFCVDGGANRLYEWCISRKNFNNNNEECDLYVPDYVCGDLDSIEDHVMQYYESKGAKLVRLNNQDLTDFTKTLKFAINCISNGQVDYDLIDSQKDLPKYSLNEDEIKKLKKIKIDQVYCFCDFSGRLDHALSNLSTLYNECLSNVNTYIISSESLTFLLKKGKNILHVNNDECRGKYCGFFPLGNIN
jgi:thiamine pyrophosphokinase